MNTKSLLSYLPESSPNKPQEYNINSITYQKSNVEESVWDLYIDISINFTDLELNPQYIFQFINVSGLTFSDLSGNINLLGIGVHDRKPEGWDPTIRYEVVDIDNDNIRFFCASILVI